MKILYYLTVPSDERFPVLADAINARPSIGVAAVYDNGLKVLLPAESACVAEFDRVAREHLALLKSVGRKPMWWEFDVESV